MAHDCSSYYRAYPEPVSVMVSAGRLDGVQLGVLAVVVDELVVRAGLGDASLFKRVYAVGVLLFDSRIGQPRNGIKVNKYIPDSPLHSHQW